MNKLSLGVAASLLALGVAACNGEQKGGEGNAGGSGGTAATAAMNTQAPNGDWTQLVNQTPEGGMLKGNPNAPVRVVEFSSMTCPHCAEFAKNDEPRLVNEFVKNGNVAFEFRHYVRDPLDITMALVARCAGPTPQFFQLTSAMFADQATFFERIQAAGEAQLSQLQGLPPGQQFQRMAQLSGLQEWAAQRGLPSAKSSQCLANQAEIDRLVQMNSDTSSNYPEFRGTPGFLINGEFVGTLPYDQLAQRIRDAL